MFEIIVLSHAIKSQVIGSSELSYLGKHSLCGGHAMFLVDSKLALELKRVFLPRICVWTFLMNTERRLVS